jgi:hypothetical protein
MLRVYLVEVEMVARFFLTGVDGGKVDGNRLGEMEEGKSVVPRYALHSDLRQSGCAFGAAFFAARLKLKPYPLRGSRWIEAILRVSKSSSQKRGAGHRAKGKGDRGRYVRGRRYRG